MTPRPAGELPDMPARPVPDPDPADDEIYDAELLPDEPDPAAPTADFGFLFGDADPPPAPAAPGEVFAAPPPLPVLPARDPHEGPTVVEGVPVDAGVLDAEVVPAGRSAARPTTVTKPARGRRPAVKITFLRPGQPSPLEGA